MSERKTNEHLANLVNDAVRSTGLDEDARVVARLLGVQFRERLGQAQTIASATMPTARRVSGEAASRLAPLGRRGSREAGHAMSVVVASPTGRSAAMGAAAGAAGSVVMGGAMLVARRMGLMHSTPPEQVTTKTAKRAGRAVRKASKNDGQGSETAAQAGESATHAPGGAYKVAASVAHVTFGAALGVGFGALHSQLPEEWRMPLPTLAESLVFATGVWALSYAGWAPALRLMPAPHEDDTSRQASLIVAHWIFGAILGAGLMGGLAAAQRQD